jgi:arginyl-tRNA synthetase
MRSGNIGESLRRILSLSHQVVITDNHIADCGIQFAILLWGVNNLIKLGFPYKKIDFSESTEDIITKLNTVYVNTNAAIEKDPTIREEAEQLAKKLEDSIKNNTTSDLETEFENIRSIVETNNIAFSAGESYLSLNNTTKIESNSISPEIKEFLINKPGVWSINTEHLPGQFDLVLGESFYQQYVSEFDLWHRKGLITKDSDGYYVDLETEKLGRCYLISSKGYSVYTGRDTLARFIWAGLFNTNSLISVVDNRQSHSFKQVFAVVNRIVKSNIYDENNFAFLTKEQTKQAISNLKKNQLHHIGFGFLSLPEGAMSARKGTVVKFHEFTKTIEAEVESILLEKTPELRKNQAFYEKIQKISTATIKWFDLSRDQEKDIVFNKKDMLSFEGNTGVYQLYTYARISNILLKTETTNQLDKNSITQLNDEEVNILNEMYTLPLLLENTSTLLKPNIISNHLLSLSSNINSWYVEYNVASEQDDDRRDALLGFCRKIKTHLGFALGLLGIETLDKI